MKKNLPIFLLLFTLTLVSQAQDTNEVAAIPRRPVTLQNHARSSMHLLFDQPVTCRDLVQGCRHLTLDLDATGFFFDAEYATPFAKGYSVVGFRLSPALAYGINEKAQLRVGFNATMFAGLDSLYRLRPTFSLIYAPTKWLTLVAGTIYGSNTHQLAMPVYDPARWIYNYQEDGLQILTKTNIWSSDTWLDWNHYLTPWTADQERFTMGTRHNFKIINIVKRKEWHDSAKPISGPCIFINHNSEKNFKIEIPTHFIASHRGGEVKTIDTNTVTTFNECIGLRFNYSKKLEDRLYYSLSLDLPIYFYSLEDNTLDNSGKAFYPTLSYEWTHWNKYQMTDFAIRAVAGFWHGDHYFSAFGSPLFWSANAYSALHIPASSSLAGATDIRNILTLTFSAEHEFKGLNLGLQVDALYDLDLRKTDLLFGFYMRFKEKFLIF